MRVDMVPGSSYDLVSNEEMHGHIAAIHGKMQEYIRQEVQGVKAIRFTSGAVALSATNAIVAITSPPRGGYAWQISRLVIAGTFVPVNPPVYRTTDPTSVTSAAGLPDVQATVRFLDTYTVNVAKYFSKGQVLLNQGEYLVANIPDAGAIGKVFCLSGEAIEVPAEMIGKLLM